MVDCAASIRAAGGSSSDLLTPRGLTAIYTGATDKYIKAVCAHPLSADAPAFISLLFILFQNNVHVETLRAKFIIKRNFTPGRVVDIDFAKLIP